MNGLFTQQLRSLSCTCSYTIYTAKDIIFLRRSFFLYYSPCHYMRAWICILDILGCYECTVRAEGKFALQGSGLVRTVALCAQRRVALLPRAIATARDALLNDRHESAALFKRAACCYSI